MDFMTSEALTELWEVQQRALRHEKEFWRLASELLSQGLVMLEDIAVIYGCHPHTARKRLADIHYAGGNARRVPKEPEPARGDRAS